MKIYNVGIKISSPGVPQITLLGMDTWLPSQDLANMHLINRKEQLARITNEGDTITGFAAQDQSTRVVVGRNIIMNGVVELALLEK